MPTVEVNPDELQRLVGRTIEEPDLLDDLFNLGLEHEGTSPEGALELEFAPDRLDRLSVEGVARSLRYQYGIDRGMYRPSVNAPDWTVIVDDSVPHQRPYVSAFIVRELALSDETLASLIQLQEKLHRTIGRRRRKGAIGIHDLAMLKGVSTDAGSPAINYAGVEPDGDRFVPLDAETDHTPSSVVRDHPIGREYGQLVEGYDAFPAIYDDIGLFSLPPIVNGERTRVTGESRDLLVELTGTDQWTIDRMATIIAYALDARGGQLEGVTIKYDDDTLERPDLAVVDKRVSHDRIERVLGVDLEAEAVIDLAERAGLDAEVDDGEYVVSIPPYRVDVLHPLDVIDDLGRAYGFNRMEPRLPTVGTIGERHPRSRLEDAIREGLIGLGFEDLLNFYLIGEAANYDRLDIEAGDSVFGAGEPARIAEPYSREYAIVRTWAIPSLMLVLENNTHRRYPQHLAEIGLAISQDETQPTGVDERRHVAGVLADPSAGFEDAKARVQFIAREHGVDLSTPATDHPTFLEGRAATIELAGHRAGVIGEVHPRILERYALEVPVAAFEFRLDALAN